MDRELLRALAHAGLSGQEYAMVLAVLAQGNPAVLRPGELSALTGIPKPHIPNVRLRLQARGIIRHGKAHRYELIPPPWSPIPNSQNKNWSTMAPHPNSPGVATDSPRTPQIAWTVSDSFSPKMVKKFTKNGENSQNCPSMSAHSAIANSSSGPQKNPSNGRKFSPKMVKILNNAGSSLLDSFSPNLVNFPHLMSRKGGAYIRYSNNKMMMMIIDNNKEGVRVQKSAELLQNSTELAQLGFLDAEEFLARYGWEKVAEAMEFVNQWKPRNPGAALRFVLERGGPPRARPRWAKYFRGRYGSQLRLFENLSGEAVDGPEGGQVPGAVPQVP